MSCRLVRRHIGAFVDGELDPATQIEFERHLAACAGCQEQLTFERAYREHVREAVGGVKAPESLEQRVRAALEAAPEPEATPQQPSPARRQRRPLVRFVPVRARYAVPAAAAAAVLLFVAGSLPFDSEGSQVQHSQTTPLLEDVVRLHSSDLPADVQGEQPKQVAQYFRRKLRFPVRPADFERRDARLIGGRVSNVRDRQAAALYYDVQGRRVTVVVFEKPRSAIDRRAMRVRLGGRELFYQQVRGYVVPIRRYAGLNYAFTGNLDRETMLQLAASSRVEY